MPGNIVANPNIQILAFMRDGIVAAPFVGAFRTVLVGFQSEGPSIINQVNFNEAERVAMVMPYDGLIHRWAVKHSSYPNQQQGEWKWTLIHGTGSAFPTPPINTEADSFIDVANPTQPFNPGPGVHEREVFNPLPGFTDKPFPFKKGDYLAFALGMKQGLFTVTRVGFVFSSVSVFIEFIRK